MRFSRHILLVVLCLALSACFGSQLQEIKPVSDMPSLSPEVDVNTLLNLVVLSIKDRQCLVSPEDPNPRQHSRGYEAYTNCIYDNTATECDAKAADLRAMRTLMERDSRLSAIADFSSVLNLINQRCRLQGRKKFSLQAILPWRARDLQRCASTPAQPLLIATAIGVRPPLDLLKSARVDEFVKWSSLCIDAKGLVFMGDHCLNSSNRRYSNAATGEPLAPSNYKKLGIESYYCFRNK